jgi:hypothetical protein
MKVFWVLAWEKYYPSRALNNVYSTHETFEEAQLVADALRRREPMANDYFDYVEIEDVSEMLGIKEKNA